jgi:hypothetical protein
LLEDRLPQLCHFLILSHMKRPLWRLAASVLIIVLAIGSPGEGQISSSTTEEVRPLPEILLEVRVLSVPNAALGPLGIGQPESGSGPANLKSFLIPLAQNEVRSLADNPRAKTVHTLTLHATSGNRTQFRVDTRVPANSSAGIGAYFLLGIGLEATPTLQPNRLVSLLAGSVVQVRRGPAPDGGAPPLLFETPLTRHEIQIPDGMTLLLGGFVLPGQVPPIPDIAPVPGNPISSYVFSKGPRKDDDSEIVVMLTPHVPGVPGPAPATANPRITAAPLPSSQPVAARIDAPAPVVPAPPVMAPAENAKVLIPDSVLSGPPTNPNVPVPVTMTVPPGTKFDFPARLSPPAPDPAPVSKAKLLIPPSALSSAPTKPNLPVPVSVTLALAKNVEFPKALAPPRAITPALTPAPKADIPARTPAVPVAPVAPLPPISTNYPSHSVQVGAFRERSRAENLTAELKKKFAAAFIESDPAARTPYRVRIGQVRDLAAARKLQRQLRTLGFDSFVVFPTST